MTTFHRAAIVSATVGTLFVLLGAYLAAPMVRDGAAFEEMVPVLLGVTLKAALAFALAGVMVGAIRLERLRMARWRREKNLLSANDNDKRRRRRAA